jgi:L-alanine-DL-glutamate epimerase-like enolase superfamily enzyme
VTDATTVPVTGGEQDNDMAQWKRMIAMRAVNVVQPDIAYIGGISRALQVARWADDAGLICTPHAANRTMIPVFTAHLLASIPNGGPFMEFSIEPETSFTDGLFTEPLQIRDGKLPMSAEPGWGVTIHPEWLEKAEYQVSK